MDTSHLSTLIFGIVTGAFLASAALYGYLRLKKLAGIFLAIALVASIGALAAGFEVIS